MSGSASDISFQPFSRGDGLPTVPASQILEDREGYLWFAYRNTLYRYDGYQSVAYSGYPVISTQTSAIPSAGKLYEDRRGNLWVATDVLTRFDSSAGTFTAVLRPKPSSANGVLDQISAVHDAKDGSLWLGVVSSLWSSTGHRDVSQAVLYQVDPVRRISIPHPIDSSITREQRVSIHAIEEDAHGRLWLGTSIGLIRFDPQTGTFLHYPHTHPNPELNPAIAFNALVWDKTGHLWVHMPAGLERFDPGTGVFDHFVAADFWHMSCDPGGRLWLSDGFPGLKVFDTNAPAETALRSVNVDTPAGKPIENPMLTALAADRRGNVWAYVFEGAAVYRYSPRLAEFGAHTSNPLREDAHGEGLIVGAAEGEDGAIWMATYSAGLERFDPRSGRITRFRHDPRNPHSIPRDHLSSIYFDRSHTLWIGSVAGMGTFDIRTGRYTHVRGSIHGKEITSMFEDSSGRFWVGDWLGPLQTVDKRSGKVTPSQAQGGYLAFEDREGNLWFGFPPGLNKLDRSGNLRSISLVKPGAPNGRPPMVESIYQDPAGTLWLSSTSGLYAFDARTENWVRYAMADGLPSEDVACVAPDDEGNLWVGTDMGISWFDLRAKKFRNFDERDGLPQHGATKNPCLHTRDGHLFFIGIEGFGYFNPREILSRQLDSPLAITGFQINGSNARLPGSDTVQLSAAQNNWSFEFAELNWFNPSRVRYRFMLDGSETKWTEVDSSHRLARYTGIAPGTYTFRVEASPEPDFSNPRRKAVRLLVAPPWWRTWWAETLGVFAFIGLLLAAYQLRVSTLQHRQRELAAMVERRTAELVEARDLAQQARDQAQSANQAKSIFLAHMSHELRNPLSSILGISSLLRDDDLTGRQREYVTLIDRSGEHLLTLINDVLDMAKIEAGRHEVAAVPFAVLPFLDEVTEMMRVKAENKNLALTSTHTPGLQPYVRADAPKLRQVLINLIGNAIKFTNSGGVVLRTSSHPNGAGRISLRFEVEDTGIGIAQADQVRIFEPFVQGGNSNGYKGTGLGLAITRQFVEIMGGAIGVESALGRGARFSVDVPVEPVSAEEAPLQSSEVSERFTLEANQPDCRVLVVEDDPENALVMSQRLSRAGFQVRVAVNGAEGVRAFQEWSPHFIWMDLRMPVMSGTEAARTIRRLPNGPGVKIAAMTASAFASEREEVMATGMDDFVRKPCRPHEIFDCMARHLGVRYRQEPLSSEQGAGRPLDRRALTDLPQDVRRELREALMSLDRERIASAIVSVGDRDPSLAAALTRLSRGLAFTAIFEAIEECESRISQNNS